VFENRVLRRLFGPKRDEVMGGWRKLQKDEICIVLFTKYKYNDQITEDEIGGACSINGENRKAHRLLVGKPEGKRPL
jgi:hypothetical protein